jgi:hypothetical protein
LKVPQANDVAKIIDLPLAVAQGDTDLTQIAKRYDFDRRQALYYVQAAELLGLLQKRGSRYFLSRLGHTYISLTPSQRKEAVVRRMISVAIISAVIRELVISPLHRVTRSEMETMVVSRAGISGATVARRVQSMFSWFSWLGDEIGLFRVSKDSVAIRS